MEKHQETNYENDREKRPEDRQPRYQSWKGKRRMAMVRHALLPVAVLTALLIIYGMTASRYYKRFLPGSMVNGLDISGMTVAEAEELLISAAEQDYALQIVFRDGQTETVSGEELELTVSFSGEISNLLEEQRPFTWLPRILGRSGMEAEAAGLRIFNTGLLSSWLNALPELQEENMETPVDACMRFDETDHLEVQPEVPGSLLRADVLLNAAENAVAAGASQLNAEDVEDAYEAPAITSTNIVLLEQIEKGNSFLNTTVTYTMHEGSEVTVDASLIRDWMSEQEGQSGWYYMDLTALRGSVADYVNSLADMYDASYGYYDFQSTSYGVLSLPVNNGSYGYVISRSGETEALYQDIVNGTVKTRVPVYSVATSLENGIGNTYIEVDTIAQKVYLYVDGENVFTTDCVTGLATDPERVTPTGVYSLYDKEQDRTLQGTVEEATGLPSYMSAVSYWMPFSGGYGLHDASWRTVFGSNIYQTNGSHGCVNLPVLAAKEIYDQVEVGTPVVVI